MINSYHALSSSPHFLQQSKSQQSPTNDNDVVVTGGAIVLPPVFRKRDRRDRTAANPTFAIPPASLLPPDTSNTLPQDSSTSDANQILTEPAAHESRARMQHATLLSPPSLPAPAIVHDTLSSAAAAASSQRAVSLQPSALADTAIPSQIFQPGNLQTPCESLDDNTTAQLYDWFLRSGPMAQGLRNAKNWRDLR